VGEPLAGRAQVEAGVLGDVARIAGADLQDDGLGAGAVLQVVAVGDAVREARAVAGAQHGLALVGQQHDLAGQDVDELVLVAVVVALAGSGAGLKVQLVHSELREPGGGSQAHALAAPAGRVKRRRVGGAEAGRGFLEIDLGAWLHGGVLSQNVGVTAP
jgi:hypothetical protein